MNMTPETTGHNLTRRPDMTATATAAAPKSTAAPKGAKVTQAVPEKFVPSFEDAPIPQLSRAVEDNPFTAVVAELVEKLRSGKLDKGKSFTAPADQVGKLSRQLGKAGNAAGVTIRQKREEVGQGRVRVTFIPTTKIDRPRKPKDDAAEVAATETETTPVG